MNLPQHLPIQIGTAYRLKEDDEQWREDYTYSSHIIRSAPTRNAHPIIPLYNPISNFLIEYEIETFSGTGSYADPYRPIYNNQTKYDSLILYDENYTKAEYAQYCTNPVHRTELSIVRNNNNWYVIARCYDTNDIPLFDTNMPDYLQRSEFAYLEPTRVDSQYGIITDAKFVLLGASIQNLVGSWWNGRKYGRVPHLCANLRIGIAFKREGSMCGDWELSTYHDSSMSFHYDQPIGIRAWNLSEFYLSPALASYSIGSIVGREIIQEIVRTII